MDICRNKPQGHALRLVVRLLLAGVVCSCGGTGGEGQPGPTQTDTSHPSWVVGSWTHDSGRNGSAEYADHWFEFADDGTVEYDAYRTGIWRFDNGKLTARYTDQSSFEISVAPGCRVLESDGTTYLRDGADGPASCPIPPKPLSAVDRCLVGQFSMSQRFAGETRYSFYEDRTYVEYSSSEGYIDGGSQYQVQGSWRLEANGDVTIVYPAGSSEVRVDVATLLGYSHDEKVTGCDTSAFAKFIGDPCLNTTIDALFCGSSTQFGFMGGDADTLYDCEGGATAGLEVCSGGCVASPPGTPDSCR